MLESFVVRAVDYGNKIVAQERFYEFPGEEQIKEFADKYGVPYVEINKRYEILPFE